MTPADLACALVAAPWWEWRAGMRRVYAHIAAEDPHIATPDTEEWRQVDGWPEYDVSSHGRVRSWRKRGDWTGRRADAPTIICGTPHHRRMQLQLKRPGVIDRRFVHVLVLEAFVGPRPPMHEAAHLDGNPGNNAIGNLRWVTAASNAAHRRIHGTVLSGERSPTARLSDEDVTAIRIAFGRGIGSPTLAAAFGVDKTTICRIGRGEAWTLDEGMPDLSDDQTAGVLVGMLREAVPGWTIEILMLRAHIEVCVGSPGNGGRTVHVGATLAEAAALALLAVKGTP